MNKEALQDLIKVHNILYNLPVVGAAVVPMEQVLTTLQRIIHDADSDIHDSENVVNLKDGEIV